MYDDSRQSDLIPPERLTKVHAVIVGVGAVGRQVSLQLASAGVTSMTLIDPDLVGEENLAPQGYRRTQVGTYKVEATTTDVIRQNEWTHAKKYPERFVRSKVDNYLLPNFDNCLFLCVDSMASRKFVHGCIKNHVNFLCDVRVGANTVRVVTGHDQYEGTLVQDDAAYQGSCTAKMTIYLANIAAGLMLNQWAKYLRNFELDRDTTLNLLSMEIM